MKIKYFTNPYILLSIENYGVTEKLSTINTSCKASY